MLTLRPPIQIAARSSMLRLHDDFSNRIGANYEVMASNLSPENMLHFMTDSAEVYMEGDSMTSLVNVNNRFSTQQINVELINNVLNRILLAEEEHMTYQDRTFIESMLQRIGITDVKQFMQQVALFKENSLQVNRLLSLYSKDGEMRRELTQYFTETRQEETEQAEEAEATQASITHLEQNILKRLDTAAIYEEIANFYRPVTEGNRIIDQREFTVAEQLLQSRSLALSEIKNEITNRPAQLTYHVVNSYEYEEGDTNIEGQTQMMEQFITAVVFNALQQSYALRQQQFLSHTDAWYDLTESLQQTVENTMNRFEAHHQKGRTSTQVTEQYNRLLTQNLANEITALEHFEEQRQEERIYRNAFLTEENLTQTEENVTNVSVQSRQGDRTSLVSTEVSNALHVRKENNETTQTMQNLEELTYLTQNITESPLERHEEHIVHGQQIVQKPGQEQRILEQLKQFDEKTVLQQEKLRETLREPGEGRELTYLTQNITESPLERHEEHIVHGQQIVQKPGQEQRILEQLSQFDEKTVLQQEKLRETLREPGEGRELTYLTQNITESPLERHEEHIVHGQQIVQKPGQEQRILEQLTQLNEKNVVQQEKLRETLREVGEGPKLTINRRKAMADVKRAMEAPEQVLLEYLKSETNVERYEKNMREQLTTAISPELLQFFEEINEYQQHPERAPEGVTMNDVAFEHLMLDSVAARTENASAKAEAEPTPDTVREIRTTNDALRQRIDRVVSTKRVHEETSETAGPVELLHRVNRTEMDEEVLEELRGLNRTVNRQTLEEQETVQETREIVRNVTNHVDNLRIETREELDNIIVSNVRGQLDHLSDQVYRRLEKRMDAEKRRRGL